MSTLIEKRDRHAIPRWRPSTLRTTPAEFVPAKPEGKPWVSSVGELEKLLSDWEANPEVPFAADLVGSALVLGEPDIAKSAALSLLEVKENLPAGLLNIARQISGQGRIGRRVGNERVKNPIAEETHVRIRRMRRQLSEGPRNPLLWTDLALAFSTLGHFNKAERCLQVANQLAPDHRFILRATARFHVHQGKPDRALRLLRHSPLDRVDPWILAADIAVSEIVGTNPTNIKIARSMLGNAKFSARHTSELASALGTLELRSGALRKAKHLLEKSLEEPTENAVAQAEWLNKEVGSLNLTVRSSEVPCAFEAKAISSYYAGRWKEAVEYCVQWQRDEPFSAGPAIIGSFVSAVVLEDYELSAEIARQGHRANPREFVMVNNLAFALANEEKAEEASHILDAWGNPAGLDDRRRIFYYATSGLVRYRLNDPVAGRALYQRAIDLASSSRFNREKAISLVFLAREEHRIHSPESSVLIANAKNAWSHLKDDEPEAMRLVLEKLLVNG